MMRDVLEAALAAEANGEPAALVTVIATEGSTPQKAGAKMLVYADGTIVGTIGGGCLEAEMTRRARVAIEHRATARASYDLTPDQAGEDGLVCGGRMEVFIEPVESAPTLCLFGAGHVAQPLARMAKAAGFRVEVADDRAKFANTERFPDADRIVVDDFAAAARKMTLGRNSFAVVVTRGHQGDTDALRAVLGKGLRFVGLLGSKPKMVHIFAALLESGVPGDHLEEVHSPLGLEIGAESPDEIAVSILAELIAVRRGVPSERVGAPMKMELPARLKAGPVLEVKP
jgi:xanthine dehydrogenase accessory factor